MYLLVSLLSLVVVLQGTTTPEKRCGSVDIRNSPRMAFQPKQSADKSVPSALLYYKECTILEGDFTISMITSSNVTNEEYPVFEKLREVTGSILVFQIKGLLSLGRMFPNLRVIGGHSLILNYALVVYQNNDLREIGLTKLTAIKNGGVRITENPRLCYSQSIDWDKILLGKIRDKIIDQVAGQCKNECQVENESNCLRDENTGAPRCWSPKACQKFCESSEYTGSGCTDDGETCHKYCLGGCSLPNDPAACHSCRNVDVGETCVDKCPDDLFEQLGRRCLTKKECNNLTAVSSNPATGEKSEWKAFQKQCHYDCPNGYQEDPTDPHNCIKCIGYCPKKCAGDTVDSIGSAMKFSKCNAIEGNLELDMRIGMESTSAEKFTEAFGEIEEISGYLLVRFSSAFMSLHMFKKLRVIHGQQLWKNMYALVVFENQNLNQLFNLENRNMTILNGTVTFHNNRMLCYKKIEAFLDHVRLRDKVNENDVSSHSNGDKAVCDEIPLTAKIVQIFNYGFMVGWMPFNTTDMDYRKFLGYQIFYKKVDKADPNMTIDDDRSACSDSWNMHFVTDAGDIDSFGKLDGTIVKTAKGELITTGVEANTLYAVYVQTRLVNHPGAKNAISKILFVTTYFATPDPARMREAYALGPDTVEVLWDPPLNEYGVITHYTVTWNLVNDADSTAVAKVNNVCSKQRSVPQIANSASSHSPNTVSLSKTKSQETCSKEEGCCKCSDVNSNEYTSKADIQRSLEEKRGENDIFEDSMQNRVFVQNCEISQDPQHCAGYQQQQQAPKMQRATRQQRDLDSPKRRHHHGEPVNWVQAAVSQLLFRLSPKDQKPPKRKNTTGVVNKQRRALRSAIQGWFNKGNNSVEQLPKDIHHNLEELNVSVDNVGGEGSYNSSYGKINTTQTHLRLTGLPHFSEYQMIIHACQDTSAPEYFCSARPLWTTVRTDPILEYDMIDPESVVVDNVTDGKPNDKRIYWSPPKTPNGYVLAYHAKLIRDDGTNSVSHTWSREFCIPFNDFEKDKGVDFLGLLDGHYTLEVRVETSTSLFNNATLIKDIFVLYTPGFFTPWTIAGTCLGVIGLLIILVICIYCIAKRVSGKKAKEYWRQTISANPEYLSQMDIYKADEWELKRDDLVLEVEIGRGTFGKVFRGYGKNITSHTGEVFGECAVKTVPETANNAERLHFLIEASVMKQFNTAFIVKLYGVVSDGQPVLVVMELMDKGNLRDFLRSHRPGAEENKDNREVPNMTQYFTWAAQIADGMAYLESMKFCHRDLAARNCMVHADESVKIGDFGMARDIYYHEYYKPAGKRLMPVRWMAPESLKDGKFTMKSDVWSFGIVMYEMLTLGQQPYAGLGNDKVFNFIGVQRHVLRKPTGCPDFWYKLMRTCWRYDPRERPSFHHIVKHLNKHVTSPEFRQISFVLNNLHNWNDQDQYYDFNIEIDVPDDQNNVYNDEFGYTQEDEDDLDECASNDREVYASHEDLPMLTALNNNRRPNETSTMDAEGLLTDLNSTGTPRQQIRAEQNLVENTF